MAGIVVGAVFGFVLLATLLVYGYSIHLWRMQGLYGNRKPYKYQPALSTAAGAKDASSTSPPPTKTKAVSIPLGPLRRAADKAGPGVAPVAAPVAAAAEKKGDQALTLDAIPLTPVAPLSPRSAASLPRNWSVHTDAEGGMYFFNTVTGQSQWTKPVA